MYGTVARMRLKPGQEGAVRDLLMNWRERRGAVEGIVGGYLYRPENDPQTLVMTVAFTDKAAYEANAQSEAQDQFYREMRAMLAEDPVWEDGEISEELIAGENRRMDAADTGGARTRRGLIAAAALIAGAVTPRAVQPGGAVQQAEEVFLCSDNMPPSSPTRIIVGTSFSSGGTAAFV